MTTENKKILDRINAYAEEKLADIDPQKTRISFQLEALKPIMQEIAYEPGSPWKIFSSSIWILPVKRLLRLRKTCKPHWKKTKMPISLPSPTDLTDKDI